MMNLEQLRSDWDALAKRDALWAILTDDSKIGGGWDVAEFFETGEIEMATVMGCLGDVGCAPNAVGAALDFGCGGARRFMAQAARAVCGVCGQKSISEEMIRKAEAMNSYAHCDYVTSVTERLPFADRKFRGTVYSNIVLVMPRKLSAWGILREFVQRAGAGRRAGVWCAGLVCGEAIWHHE